MEKEPYTKFCGVLISSHEVIKSESFESGVTDVPTNTHECTEYLIPGFLFPYFC